MIRPVTLPGGVVMRLATERDAAALLDAYTRNRDHLKRWEPRRSEAFYTLKGQAEGLKGQLQACERGQAVPWLLLDGERVVGRMTLSNIVRGPWLSADLGYWVDAAYNGRGIATAAVGEVCRLADEEIRLHRVAASTLLDNAASQSVLRKSGFEPYGTAPDYLEIDGRWQDHLLWQRILNDRPAFSF